MSITRSGGVLMPVSSLHSPYGIGTFGKAAYEFVDFLKQSGAKLWQVLPLGPTGFGDSPYQSFSAFAGNPYFIDLDMLIAEGLLTEKDLQNLKYNDETVDYESIYNTRFDCLYKAFSRFDVSDGEFLNFCLKNKAWLEDYSFYMAVKNYFDQKSWSFWDKEIKNREKSKIEQYKTKLKDEISFYKFLQFKFFSQWYALKAYANENGIKIVGDIPIYVAMDSADTYFNPQLFQFDEQLSPVAVAGCPPDAFSETGQLWGNPLYNWDNHEKDGFKWWISRIEHCFNMYDIVRIDHFRGFESYYSIDAKSDTAINGKWEKGPGMKLFKAIKSALGDVDIIAEDLGFLTNKVYTLLKRSGFCGMKVLQFAFDELSNENKYLPHNYDKNCVVYTGTHDNTTTLDYYKKARPAVKRYIRSYLNCSGKNVSEAFVRAAYASTAVMAIVPMADLLNLGQEGRINTPSTLGNNWLWRITKAQLCPEVAEKLKHFTTLYGR
ncbi:MAG: 4-alpha-glucanotransferase [Clostridia bacterium]|nr:4-alpha-glucanotransferase [Clostridia bacterium]